MGPIAGSLVSPGLPAPKRKIVGIGGLAPGRCLRLDDLIGNALALAIGNRLFLGIEANRQLLLHVTRRGPAHQRLDRTRLLRLIIELPFAGLGGARLHRVFGRLKDACGHGWSDPFKRCSMEARGANGRDSIEPFFRDLAGDSKPSMLHFSIIFMPRCDNLAKSRAGSLSRRRNILASITSKRPS